MLHRAVAVDDVTKETYYYGHQSIVTGRCRKYSRSTHSCAFTADLDLIFNTLPAMAMTHTHATNEGHGSKEILL